MKWIPFFFSERKCANLAFAAGSGEPGGDDGMLRFGMGGRVKSWMRDRDVGMGGDDGLSSARSGCRSFVGCDGPTTGTVGWT